MTEIVEEAKDKKHERLFSKAGGVFVSHIVKFGSCIFSD